MGQAPSSAQKDARSGQPVFQRVQPRDVPDEGYVLYVWLEKVVHYFEEAEEEDAVEVRLSLSDQRQRQQSTKRAKWCPAERYEFVLENDEDDRLVVQVGAEAFGVLPLAVGTRESRQQSENTHEVALTRRGDETSARVVLTTKLAPKLRAFDVVYDLVWEYGRVIQGGLEKEEVDLDDDPGRYSDERGVLFAMLFDDVAPKIPAGYEVRRSWAVAPTAHEPDGWLYSSGFRAYHWHDAHFPGAKVCRRRWVRECQRSLNKFDHDASVLDDILDQDSHLKNPLDDVLLHVPNKPRPPDPLDDYDGLSLKKKHLRKNGGCRCFLPGIAGCS